MLECGGISSQRCLTISDPSSSASFRCVLVIIALTAAPQPYLCGSSLYSPSTRSTHGDTDLDGNLWNLEELPHFRRYGSLGWSFGMFPGDHTK